MTQRNGSICVTMYIWKIKEHWRNTWMDAREHLGKAMIIVESLPKKCIPSWMFNPCSCMYSHFLCHDRCKLQNIQCTLLFFVNFLYAGRLHSPTLGMPGRTQKHCVTVVDAWGRCQRTNQGLFHVVSCDQVCSHLEDLLYLVMDKQVVYVSHLYALCGAYTLVQVFKRVIK